MDPDFCVVLVEPAAARPTPGLPDVVKALEKVGVTTRSFAVPGDNGLLVNLSTRVSAFVYSVGGPLGVIDVDRLKGLAGIVDFVQLVRTRNPGVPIFLLGDRLDVTSIPADAMAELHGFVNVFEDTPEFVAGAIARAGQTYLDSVAPPFFKALTTFARASADSWHAPGHSGGVAFLKSPVGAMFHDFFGQNMLRADVCNAVEELGQLLDHTGPVAESERNAARIFSADHLFFVTNGTSTSNKIVWNALVSPGDVVVVDRNCHKSILHGLILTGAIPVFLNPTRDQGGLIGPIPLQEFTWESIQAKIDANPFIRDKAVVPRLLCVTQSTYDGIVYNVDMIKQELDGRIDVLHFDEAWLPHATFHEFYAGMHAISPNRARCLSSMVFATQSTHKVLAGLSQASQILVQDSETVQLDERVLNEAFLMHTSTSPQYAIIASCDVSAAMMDGAAGRTLVGESLSEALEFRRAMIRIADELADSWWFSVWGPDTPTREGLGLRTDWQLSSDDSWHEFAGVEPGFTMLDPIKATLVTPGLSRGGALEPTGIPAAVVSRYLAEHGVVVEKTGLYSFLIMFTIGVTRSRWQSLLIELRRFKDAYDANAPLARVMPRFLAEQASYEGLGLRDLCQRLHEVYRAYDVPRLTTAMYVGEPAAAMLPAQAWAQLTRRNVELVPIEELEGRIAAILLTPYPPGIPLVIPGERIGSLVVDYLRFTEVFNQTCPGMETFVHGLDGGDDRADPRLFVTCVRGYA